MGPYFYCLLLLLIPNSFALNEVIELLTLFLEFYWLAFCSSCFLLAALSFKFFKCLSLLSDIPGDPTYYECSDFYIFNICKEEGSNFLSSFEISYNPENGFDCISDLWWTLSFSLGLFSSFNLLMSGLSGEFDMHCFKVKSFSFPSSIDSTSTSECFFCSYICYGDISSAGFGFSN